MLKFCLGVHGLGYCFTNYLEFMAGKIIKENFWSEISKQKSEQLEKKFRDPTERESRPQANKSRMYGAHALSLCYICELIRYMNIEKSASSLADRIQFEFSKPIEILRSTPYSTIYTVPSWRQKMIESKIILLRIKPKKSQISNNFRRANYCSRYVVNPFQVVLTVKIQVPHVPVLCCQIFTERCHGHLQPKCISSRPQGSGI